jgi:hypothetical protein
MKSYTAPLQDCYGCRRVGDVTRFAEIYRHVEFSQTVAPLREWRVAAPLLHGVERFYRMQLDRHGEAVDYLHQRGLPSPELVRGALWR